MRIVVAGATGLIGSLVMATGTAGGHTMVPLSRSTGVDLTTGAGLAERVAGADAVIDVSNTAAVSARGSEAFFAAATRSLLAAAAEAGVAHHVALSIVGIDAAPHGYYRGKLLQERLVVGASVPWSIQRATQFHEFAAQLYRAMGRGPLHAAFVMRTQPIAAHEVATALVDTVTAGALGRRPDLAGPHPEDLVDMVRRYARVAGHRALVIPVRAPGALGRAQRSGALLPGPDARLGTQTFAEWLATSAPSGASNP